MKRGIVLGVLLAVGGMSLADFRLRQRARARVAAMAVDKGEAGGPRDRQSLRS